MDISLVNLLLSSFGLFILFKFVFLPFTTKVAANDSSAYALKKYIARNIVDFGGLFFLLTTISSGTTWIIVQIINKKGGTTLGDIKNSIDFVKEVDVLTSTLANEWAITTTMMLSAALIIIAYKSTKKTFNERLSTALFNELERLKNEFDDGKWENLPHTEEMGKVYILIQEYFDKIENLQSIASSKEEISALHSLIENKDNLISYLKKLDLQRRINVEIEDEEYPKPKFIKDKIFLFFLSQGLISTFKKGSFVLFIIGVLLLIPSLLSIGSIVINDITKTKIALLNSKVEKLELEIQKKIVAEKFDKILYQTDKVSDEPLSDEDEKSLNELSKVFENNIVATRIGIVSVNFARTSKITNHNVKTAILDQFSTDNKVKVHTSEVIPRIVVDAVKLEKNTIFNNEPSTNLGQRIKIDLRVIATNNKVLWSHYKKLAIDATKTFQVPASSRSIKGMMISNVIGHIAQVAVIPNDAGKIVGNLAKIPSDIAEQFYVNESKRYMVALAKAEYIDDVMKDISEVKYRPLLSHHLEELKAYLKELPEKNSLSKIMMENPPSLSRVTEPHVQMEKAKETIRNIAKSNGSLGSQTYADALSSFGDYFPGYKGEERKTTKGKVISASATSSSRSYATSKAAFVRSRSYGKLRGFSRIGGVLIGRMPAGEKILDVIDINWKKEEENYSFTLVLSDGKKVNIGKFDPAIVYLALGYVADGRITTITMVSSDPLYDLKILLHPTLVDTGLGCRAIKLDQIADESTSDNIELKKLRKNENLGINNAKILYSFAWAVRLTNIADSNQNIAQEIIDYITHANNIISTYSEKIKSILETKKYNLDFISSKSDFYDASLVKLIKNCKNTKDYRDCIKTNSPTLVSTKDSTWLYPPAKTTEWSGVREIEYSLDKEFNFLLVNKHNKLWPFRFMVQTVFTSPPTFVKNNESYSDTNPWEFDSVNKLLMKIITINISKNQELKSIIKDMREFAILQRLFRVALNNKFSINFPIEKLAFLAKETKPYLSGYHRTLRWLPKPGVLEKVSALKAVQSGNNDKLRKTLMLQKQLRVELGISKDEKQIRLNNGDKCPMP